MNETKNIINFYLVANKLKYKIRQGWLEVEIDKDRLESVSEHIYGCLMLVIGMYSEYDLDLDIFKVFKMITLHELEECLMPDFTVRANITKEQKIEKGRECVHRALEGLMKKEEIENLLDEFNAHETKESKFCYMIDKIECDFQAKIYDLEGTFFYDKAREDLPFYGDRATEIDKLSKTASDFWIEFDRPIYKEDNKFSDLLNEIQKIKKL